MGTIVLGAADIIAPAMRPSESLFYEIRGLRYHVRRWPGTGSPDASRRMVLLHGWMDVSASFQFLVDALDEKWEVYAPDWRGYGLTDWVKADSYWFHDYVAEEWRRSPEYGGRTVMDDARDKGLPMPKWAKRA